MVSDMECGGLKALGRWKESGCRPTLYVPDRILPTETSDEVLVSMRPEEFHKTVHGRVPENPAEAGAVGVDFHGTEHFLERSCGDVKDEQGLPSLRYDVDRDKIVSHEGRMRTYVLSELGKSSVPVEVKCVRSEDGSVRTTQCPPRMSQKLRSADVQFDVGREEFEESVELHRRDFEDSCGVDVDSI